jgi:saccharopine dehydrogenase-like NADP-dependent oxidoreductase
MKTVLLIGATGIFGQRLARHLAAFDGLHLVLTSREKSKAESLCKGIVKRGALASCDALAFDKAAGFGLFETVRPWLVIDASGPFQQLDFSCPMAALACGAHYIDLADARDYLVGFHALDKEARARGLVALAGASSTPALSSAALAAITTGWQRIDAVDIAITPGGKSDIGPAVLKAILSYAGTEIETFDDGQPSRVTAWTDSLRRDIPGLGKRRVAPVETADAALLSRHFNIRSRLRFHAGLESPIEQWGLVFLAHLRRLKLLRNLQPLAGVLLKARRLTQSFTTDRGAMVVEAQGLDAQGRPVRAQWSLLAEKGDGPLVPMLPAAAALQALLANALPPGAGACVAALPLAAVEQEMRPYAIRTEKTEHVLLPASAFEESHTGRQTALM